ncbi:CooT family nickel-binding protein [Chloroflexota bacterium]
MCLAKVDLPQEQGGHFGDIALLKIEDGNITLRTLFGEEKKVKAEVKEVNFQDSTISLEIKV